MAGRRPADSGRRAPGARLRRAVSELAAAGLVDEALRLKDEVLATSDDPVVRAEVAVVATWLQLYTERALSAADEATAEASHMAGARPDLARQLRVVAAMALLTNGSILRSLALVDPGEAPADISTAAPTLESTWAPQILALVGRVPEADRWLPPDRVELCRQLLDRSDFSLPFVVAAQTMAVALTWLERPAETAGIAARAINAYRPPGSRVSCPISISPSARPGTGRTAGTRLRPRWSNR
jgi:hypothetical protein